MKEYKDNLLKKAIVYHTLYFEISQCNSIDELELKEIELNNRINYDISCYSDNLKRYKDYLLDMSSPYPDIYNKVNMYNSVEDLESILGELNSLVS